MKIIFCMGSFDGTGEQGAILTDLISKHLEKIGIEIISVADNKETYLTLKKLKRSCHFIPDEIINFENENLMLYLSQIEKKYDCSIEKILRGDNDYSELKREKALSIISKQFMFWERLIEKEKPDFVLGGGVRLLGLIPYEICKKNDIVFLGFDNAPFSRRSLLEPNVYGRRVLVDYYYNKELSFSQEEIEDVDNMIKNINQSRKTKKETLQYNYGPKISLLKVKFFFNRLKVWMFIERGSPYMNVWRGTKKYFMRLIRNIILKFSFYDELPKKNYFFFPLQVIDDSNFLVWNNHIDNQKMIIQALIRSLPSNMSIVVKEHPVAIGCLPLKELKEIKRLPNVKLVSPYHDSKEVIKNSVAVTTISGTSGLEALIMNKPVVSMGNAYYNFDELVFDGGNWPKLDKVLRGLVNGITKDQKIANEKLIHILRIMRKFSYKCEYWIEGLYYSNFEDNEKFKAKFEQKNIAKVGDMIIEFTKLYSENKDNVSNLKDFWRKSR